MGAEVPPGSVWTPENFQAGTGIGWTDDTCYIVTFVHIMLVTAETGHEGEDDRRQTLPREEGS
jgi:hypothetical protein